MFRSVKMAKKVKNENDIHFLNVTNKLINVIHGIVDEVEN